MIGLTLGVTAGTSFLTLLVALCFHQFFEGLAIGTAAVDAGLGSGKTTILGLAYSVTTPVGIAIGGCCVPTVTQTWLWGHMVWCGVAKGRAPAGEPAGERSAAACHLRCVACSAPGWPAQLARAAPCSLTISKCPVPAQT